MNDHLISLYIDDELSLQEKIVFVETVHADSPYARETIELLEQEKILKDQHYISHGKEPERYAPSFFQFLARRWWPAVAGIAAGVAVVLAFMLLPVIPGSNGQLRMEEHRFVLYSPHNEQLNIVGTFTDWQPIPMERIGSTGYWGLTIKIPRGEHKYSFLVGNGQKMADPTVLTKENDDFGGENSVISIGEHDEPVS